MGHLPPYPGAYLAQFGFIKWRHGVFSYDDDATLVAILPKRLSADQRGGAWNYSFYVQDCDFIFFLYLLVSVFTFAWIL